MKYYLLQAYGGYAQNDGIDISVINAKNDDDAYKKSEDFDHSFATPLLLNRKEAEDLLKQLKKVL